MTAHVLILCRHNSARSVLAEGMLNHLAARLGRDVRAHSAGSAPSGRINPFAIEALQNAGIDAARFRSKSWDEFSRDTRQAIGYRMLLLLALPLESTDSEALRVALLEIGRS